MSNMKALHAYMALLALPLAGCKPDAVTNGSESRIEQGDNKHRTVESILGFPLEDLGASRIETSKEAIAVAIFTCSFHLPKANLSALYDRLSTYKLADNSEDIDALVRDIDIYMAGRIGNKEDWTRAKIFRKVDVVALKGGGSWRRDRRVYIQTHDETCLVYGILIEEPTGGSR